MRTTKLNLVRIINEEISRVIEEACGCVGVSDAEPGMFQVDRSDDELPSQFSRSEALELVAAIANMTTCPVTQRALLDVVEDLGGSMGEEWNLEDEDHPGLSCDDAHEGSSHEDWQQSSSSVWGSGITAGEEARDRFSYTGDLPSDPGDARGLGYRTALMGLTGDDSPG